ncbi:MAG: hypothetical protein ACXAD7_02040 [Candidatus Kariarchaeaceae archaeon]|jgi:hypothetical protein
MIDNELLPILIVEVFLFIVSLVFLMIEIKSMSAVLWNRKTLLLIGFLFTLSLAYFTRSTGIYTSNEDFRLFGPTISAIFGGVFIIAWTTSLVQMKPKIRYLLIYSFIGGLTLFILGRWGNIFFLELVGLILSMSVIIGVVLKMFFFSFQKSPYIKARQRIFGMMIGFIGFSLFEVAAVVAMNREMYLLSAFLFLLELPSRFVLTLSILLPQRVVEVMSKWIN